MLFKVLVKGKAAKTTACLLVLSLVLSPAPGFAGSFEDSLQSGKDLGSQVVEDFSPSNIEQTLSQRGLGSASEIAPYSQEAQSAQGSYSQYYWNPALMEGASGGGAAQFVDESYAQRTKFDLSKDPVFGNLCLEEDEDGRCLRYSFSRDILTNSYRDCERIVVPRYGEAREEKCYGEYLRGIFPCEVRASVNIVTENVQGPCNQIVIDDRPGQIYAVCRDIVSLYRVVKGRISCFCGHYSVCNALVCQGCGIYPNACSLCRQSGCPSDAFVVGSEAELPAGAQFIGRGVSDVAIYGRSGDRVLYITVSDYYVHRRSVVERVLLSRSSSCGENFEQWLDNCVVKDYQRCDANGLNCVYSIREFEETGNALDLSCQNFASSVGLYQGSICQYSCSADFDGCKSNCIGQEGVSSCEGARDLCLGNCDEAYANCRELSQIGLNNCLGTCEEDPDCMENCQAQYDLSLTTCQETRASCSDECGSAYSECAGCIDMCESSYCGTRCETRTMSNYEICSLPDGTEGMRINGVTAKEAAARSFFTTNENGLTVTWQVLLGGSGIKEAMNDWWSKVVFECGSESDSCKQLEDMGCVFYSQRCLDPGCDRVEYTYRCGSGGLLGYTVAYSCGGDIRCMGTECVDGSYEANTDFASAAGALEVLNQYRVDVTGDMHVFPGEARQCQASPNNCCRRGGGGVSIGDYVNAARSALSLYSYTQGGASATWVTYANAFTYALSGQQTGSLSGLLGTTVSDALGTATSVIYTAPGVVSYESANAMGIAVTSQGITEVTMVSAELISALATVATVISIALVVYSILKFAQDWMFQCKREDIVTSSKLQLRLCHLVGTKKTKKLGVVTKRTNVYCCFNSILARLIHEQGRPQIGMSWGSASSPNCRGFSPEELGSLDFSRMDLSEYMQYVEHKTVWSSEEEEIIRSRIRQEYR